MDPMDALGPVGLVAISREICPLLDSLPEPVADRWGETTLYQATLAGRPVALAEVLPGPVNGALGAQALIARFHVNALISFGSAGALDPSLKPGDLIIAQRAIAHDAGAFVGSHFDATGIMGRDGSGRVGFRHHFEANPYVVSLATRTARSLGMTARTGTVVTGNQVILASARNRYLRHKFGADVVEMETAAIAQVAVAHGLPWGAVRAVSDTASDEYILDYGRLRVYLDDGRPAWRQQLARLFYLASHPTARKRLSRLRQGLALASSQAADLVAAMLETWDQANVGNLASQLHV
jgi:adenosylhomocysteine nucleosidase